MNLLDFKRQKYHTWFGTKTWCMHAQRKKCQLYAEVSLVMIKQHDKSQIYKKKNSIYPRNT
jgi:hypothetical protein